MAILDPVKLGSFVDDPSADDANIAFARINANEKLLNEEIRPKATGGTGNTTGLAASATKLETARTLSWTGDVTGSTPFDGTANKATAMTLAASGVTAGTYKSVTVNAKGLVTAGTDVVTGLVTAATAAGITNVVTTNTNTFLNVTEKVGAAAATVKASAQLVGAGAVTVTSDATGKVTITSPTNAATASKLLNPVKINGTDFDGTADIDIPSATTAATGVVKLVNDLTTGGTGDALTAEMGKWLLGQFDTGAGSEFLYFKLPNKNSPAQPIIVMLGTMAGEIVAGNSNTVYFPFEFPNGFPRVFVCNGDGIASRNNVISVSQDIRRNAFGWIGNSSGATRANYIAIGV